MSKRGATTNCWLLVVAATATTFFAFDRASVPTAALFAALFVGIGYALVAKNRALRVPGPGLTVGQALIGVALGAEMQPSTLRAVAADWLGVSVVTLGTLLVSLAVGLLVARRGRVNRATGALGLVAGGASGIVAMADELGADGRLVAFMQYLRVLVVVIVAPVVAFALLEGDRSSASQLDSSGAGVVGDLAFTAGCALAGVLIARRLKMTAGSLLFPLVLTAVFAGSGLLGEPAVPTAVQNVAFVLIGWQVGLRFTAATIREAQALLPWVLTAIVTLILACAGLALLLVPLAHVTFADAYLATSPGGLYAVLAASVAINANTTFVVSVQVFRIFVMMLVAPPLIRIIVRSERARRPSASPPPGGPSAVADLVEEA
ncbi:MAG: AbrB family transcriptional regulator [Actinomycetota bacterium]